RDQGHQTTVDGANPGTAIATLKVSLKGRDCPVAVSDNRFLALVRLAIGTQQITLSFGDQKQTLALRYERQTNPYYVRMVWMTDSEGDTTYAVPPDSTRQQDYVGRMQTAAELMQTFTAERMHDIGLPRQTFRLERDEQGKVVVHTFQGPRKAQEYQAMPDQLWWRDVYRWINSKHQDAYAKNVVLAAYTRKDPQSGEMLAHTALGGGNLGLFGSASVFSWPSSLPDTIPVFKDDSRFDSSTVHNDSIGRDTIWALASTTLGATLHETGHTFGLPHCRDPKGIMTRGFDHFNRVFTLREPPHARRRRAVQIGAKDQAYFAPISARFLQHSPWFALDEPNLDKSPLRITRDGEKESATLTIRCKSGVAWVGYFDGDSVREFDAFEDAGHNEHTRTVAEIEKRMEGKRLTRVTAISFGGQQAQLRIP
ncbi:MAG: metallopeptidase, partial [Planctomycetota bacterium]